MEHYIITGTSSGLGKALAKELYRNGETVHCISRSPEDELIAESNREGSNVYYHIFDLNKPDEINKLADDVFKNIRLEEASSICLINNAGILDPISPAHHSDNEDVITHFNINLLAPVILSMEFLKKTMACDIRKMIINISSGAATNPYHGWSSYCSGKAALEMFTKCTGLEQNLQDNPVLITSIAPGIIETGMQEKIRSADEKNFIHKKKFVRYKEEGLLQTAETAASRLLSLINNNKLLNGSCIDLRDH